MKDNFNIEELFRSNLESLEADVSPNAWTNIQQGLQAQGAVAATVAAKTGLSLFVKSIIIGSGIVAATVAGVYLFNDDEPQVTADNSIVAIDDSQLSAENQSKTLTDNLNTEPGIVDWTLDSDNGEDNSSLQVKTDIPNSPNNNSDKSISKTDDVKDPAKTDVANNDDKTDPDDSKTDVKDKAKNDGKQILADPIDTKVSASLQVINVNKAEPAHYRFVSNAINCDNVSWDFGDGTTGEGFEIEHKYAKPGEYRVTMNYSKDYEGFSEGITITVESKSAIGIIPNIISPNGDRLNDFFCIQTKEIEKLTIVITDLKGNTVFESSEVDFEWYGTNMFGEKVEGGSYFYQIVAVGYDGTVISRQGYVELTK